MPMLTMQDQTKIFYNDLGEGQPIVLIHGWPLSADMWEYQIPHLLDRGFRVISYDRRGFGRSGKPLVGYDYDTLADDLNTLINDLELEEVILVGFSMGGGEVARYLSLYGSQKVAKAILISSVVPYMLKDDSNPDGVDMKVFEQMMVGLRADRPHFLADFAKKFYGVSLLTKPVSEEILQWTAFHAYHASAIATIECVKAFGMTDFRADLQSMTVPTLVIHGTADSIVPMRCSADVVAQQVKGAQFLDYDGAPHGLFMTHQDQLNRDLVEFLGQPARQIRPGLSREQRIAGESRSNH